MCIMSKKSLKGMPRPTKMREIGKRNAVRETLEKKTPPAQTQQKMDASPHLTAK
jgi:hypothetical protein